MPLDHGLVADRLDDLQLDHPARQHRDRERADFERRIKDARRQARHEALGQAHRTVAERVLPSILDTGEGR